MARTLLIRGMLCGLAAGLLVFVYARLFGEAPIDSAIGLEEHVAHAHGGAHDVELVSRGVQAGWGLLVGTVLYGTAVGGLFGLAFAFALGRLGRLGPRETAVLLAAAGFVAVCLVPFLKYPANPPGVGNADTIGPRTALYFGMMAISIVGMIAALNLWRVFAGRLEPWYAGLAAGGFYLAVVIVAGLVLPGIDEVPADLPATLLWQFRVAAVGMQVVLWVTLGLGFGELARRSLATGRRTAPRRA